MLSKRMVTNTLSIPISFASLSNNLSSSFPYPFPRNAGAIPYPIFPPAFLSASVKEWLIVKQRDSEQEGIVDGWKVPSTTFWLYADGIPVGFGSVRHFLTEALRKALCKYLSRHQLTIFLIPTLFSILLNLINSSLSVCLIISYGFNVRQEQSRQTLLPGLMLFYGHLHFVPAFVFIIRALSRRAG